MTTNEKLGDAIGRSPMKTDAADVHRRSSDLYRCLYTLNINDDAESEFGLSSGVTSNASSHELKLFF